MIRAWLLAAALLLSTAAHAQEPAVRPVARPVTEVTWALRPIARLQDRPDLAIGGRSYRLRRAERGLFAFSPFAAHTSMRPLLRPAAIVTAARARQQERLRGQICGDVAIQGEPVGVVPGPGACGIDDAVRVRSVAGVALSPQPVMDCRTASALRSWVKQSVIPSVGGEGGGVAGLHVASHYACRGRNNQAGARLSEHAKGRAVDISAIRLRDGSAITVLRGWGHAQHGARLRAMWRGACGIFGTVLGPEANRFHLDHFHFDTARYRSGSYCR